MRAELPVLARFAYLNAGTFGPFPRRAASALADAVVRDLQLGRSSREFFESVLELREAVREAFRLLLGAPEGSVALTASTTESCNLVYGGLQLGPGDEVVTTDSEHPGLFGGLLASGATVRIAGIRDRPAGDALAALEAELSDRTRLIALSHVSWLTGAVLPVRELAGRGVPLLVDGAQAAGAIPVDVEELGCDFYTVSAQKWLLGPDATGCLYVRPERVGEIRLAMPSYLSWQHPDYVPREGAARFDTGWIPTGSLAALRESLAFASRAGAARFDRARLTAARCRELLAARAEVVTEPDQATLVSFRWPEPEALVARLAAEDVVVRDLPGTGLVRASCGWWTSEEDLERLVRVL
ncbi:MAG TPA: aminotransferase class V-fold PLP-dependent enzyme [Gaiellaceae bacterium]|nr:aminotransferase class V-fold PLP-dependent enzyme [Gaiellaceae bacterium]